MTPLTEDLIKKHLGDKVKKIGKSKWKVTLLYSGAVITINEKRVDPGKYSLLEYRTKKGIEEWAFQADVVDVLNLGKEVWGDDLGFFDTPGLTKQDEDAFVDWAEDNGISIKKSTSKIIEHFGSDAVEKRCWFKADRFPAWKISKADGSFVLLAGGAIEEVRGDLWPAAIRYSKDVLGAVRICGSEEHIQTGMAHARGIEGLNIDDVVPEILPKSTCSVIGLISCSAGFGLPFVVLPAEQAFIVGLALGFLIIPLLLSFALSGWMNKEAVDKGKKMMNSMPAIHGNRSASTEDLQKGGWIEPL